MQGIFLVELGSDPTWLHFALAGSHKVSQISDAFQVMNLQSSLAISLGRYRKPSDEHVTESVTPPSNLRKSI